jgi:hypothetical protein
MGVIPARETVELPKEISYLFDIYLDVRFSVNNENKLVPRDALTFGSLNDYKQAMQVKISPTECSVIMSADAIYNTQAE